MLHDSDAPQVILKTTLIVAATELPSDLHPLMAALVGTINAFIDKGLKRNSRPKKTRQGPGFLSKAPQRGITSSGGTCAEQQSGRPSQRVPTGPWPNRGRSWRS